MDNITCEVCGNKGFTKDAGFYYCTECQTQTQEIREIGNDETVQKKTKKSAKTRQSHDFLTSWECYNYILVGLADELISLGVDPRIKKTIIILWFKYLRTIEVFDFDDHNPPKLAAVNSRKDAEIVYGQVPRKKRRRTPSPSAESCVASSDVSYKKEYKKSKKTLVHSEYNELSQDATLSGEQSLHNQSLSSLRSPSEQSNINLDNFKNRFCRSARKSALKKMSKSHFKQHLLDMNTTLYCHFKYRTMTQPYTAGPEILTRNKLFAIMYLALLMHKDQIQLSDIFRFIREKHLSFHNVSHFFPETAAKLNINTFDNAGVMFSHLRIRKMAAKMAKLLKVTKYIPVQNLVELCKRFCEELNLPKEIGNFAINLISRTAPKLKFSANVKIMPNYEARAICFIIFILKLLFGLDGETEHKFSMFARKINAAGENAFIWEDWIKHIQLRKLILQRHHFPTYFLSRDPSFKNTKLITDFLVQNLVEAETFTVENELLKTILEKLDQPKNQQINFPPSVTPSKDYLRIILNSAIAEENEYQTNFLQLDFTNSSMDYAIRSPCYLNLISNKIILHHRGANNNLNIVPIESVRFQQDQKRAALKKKVAVKITDEIDSSCSETFEADNIPISTRRFNTLLANFEARNRKSREKTVKKLQKLCDHCHSNVEGDEHEHFFPYERYWARTRDVERMNKQTFDTFFKTFPYSFQLLLIECARILEQTTKELYYEFNTLETFLCYIFKINSGSRTTENFCDPELNKILDKTLELW